MGTEPLVLKTIEQLNNSGNQHAVFVKSDLN